MRTKNLSAKLLLAFGVLAAISAMCTATSNAPALDPRIYVEAHATATAIAPAIVPTVQYNERVLPTLQAVEAEEIGETTRNKQRWQRTTDTAMSTAIIAWQTTKEVAALATAISISFVATSICAFLSCFAWERIKRARAYVPVQRVPDYAWYMPSQKMLGDTRSGIGLLEAPPTAKEHAQNVREFRGVVIRSFVASFFDAVLRRKTNVTQWMPDDSREIIVQ